MKKEIRKKRCEHGDKLTGWCCCNCTNQIKLYKHPWNTINKGSVSVESGLYACTVEHEIEKNYSGTIFEFEHGLCELHTMREYKKKNAE